jgi:hypothetical protein
MKTIKIPSTSKTDTTDTGKVRLGGLAPALNAATKDSGRVRMGAGMRRGPNDF